MKKLTKFSLPVILFLFSFILYTKTLLPGLGFWDTGEFQTIVYSFDIAHPTGYPTYIILGKIFLTLFPFGSVAWRMNLLSAIYVSSGIAILGVLVRKITGNNLISLGLGMLIAVCPFLWKVSIVADPHSLHFLFTSIYLFLTYKILEEKEIHLLPILYLVTGVSLGNHMLSVFFLPALLVTSFPTFKRKEWVLLGKSVLFLLLGSSVYLSLFIISSFKPPLTIDYSIRTLSDLRKIVFGQDFSGLMGTWTKGTMGESIKFYFDLASSSLSAYFLAFALPGLIFQFKKNVRLGLSTFLLWGSTLYFSIKYQNAAIERYFILPQVIYVIWMSYFFSFLLNVIENNLGKIKYRNFFTAICSILVLLSSATLISKNYKNIDQSKNLWANTWSEEVLDNLEPNSVIFSWWSYSTPLWYQQKINGLRPDVLIINDSTYKWESAALNYLRSRPVYFIEKVDLKEPSLRLFPKGNVYYLSSSENHF